MAKTQVGPMEFLPETLQSLSSPGLLLVSRDDRRRPNAMTIGWGSIGIYWARPVFVVPVRKSRYTYGCIKNTGDFTVNVLPGKLADLAAFCGTVSGRDHDKLTEAHLTPAPSLVVKSPIIEECIINYECRVVHANDLLPKAVPSKVRRTMYPRGDYHRFFFGEILAVHAQPNVRRRL
ncbi:MAG: flavin reductase family protein [Armatimonadota bacterium]|nr:MAG: flavin reductase family protein [Armatimonadota bacterium]